MEEQLNSLEAHVAKLESIVFDKKVVIPNPPFLPEDHIEPELIKMSEEKGLIGFCGARRVPADYYEKNDLEYRRKCVGAQSAEQLTKCVIYEIQDCPKDEMKYICVMVQYIDKINNRKLLDATSKIIGTKVTQMQMADESIAGKLSGAKHNAMTPVFLRPQKGYEKYKVSVLMSQRIAAMNPPFFWLGGGEVDVKYGIDTRKFVATFKPHIYDISA